MSKKNQIAYTRPEDPNFLKRIKEQIGYKEGYNIETKRQKLDSDEDFTDSEDEQPQIVVIKRGDLTAEEAELEKQRILKEESEKPADLTERIVFKPKSKLNTDFEKSSEKSSSSKSTDKKNSSKTKNDDSKLVEGPKNKTIKKQDKSKLSFVDDDEEEEGNYSD